MKRVAVIGGGMAGLAAAYELSRKEPAVDWHLFEQSDRLGGKIITEHVDGFTIEGGPDSFITQKPWALELCRELELESEYIPCNSAAQKVYILVKGRLCAMPDGFRLTVPTRIIPFLRSPLFSWPAKLRMGLEPFIPARRDDEDESVSAFITRRLGKEAADKIGGPLMAGIYVADPERLSLMSTFPMFRAIEKKHGSLIGAMRATSKQAKKSDTPMFISLRKGMGQLVDTLVDRLGDRCQTGQAVERITRTEDGLALTSNGMTQTFDDVILSTPLFETGRLLAELVPSARDTLAAMRYVSTATVSLGFRLPLAGVRQPMDGFGFVIPRSEQRRILACTWNSMKFAERAPADHALLRVFVGGEGHEYLIDLDDEALIALVRDELREIWGLTADPIVQRVFRWQRGNPQYDVGHATRMQHLIDEVQAVPGVHVAGSGYKGIGLPDCIRSGREAAIRACE